MSEQELPPLLDMLPDGIVIADSNARVSYANDSARSLLGEGCQVGSPLSQAMSLQDLDGNDWYSCVAPYDGVPLRKALLESAWYTPAGGEVLVTGTLRRDRPGGQVMTVALSLRNGLARDRIERDRSDMVATVAHELRSPLTGVKGFTATLLQKWEQLTESQRLLMLNTVDADANRLRRLIEELLDAARIDSGRLSVRKEPIDIAEAVQQQVAPLSASRDRSISVEVNDHPTVWADKDKLAQILGNLIENAVRHGGGNVTVTVDSTPGGGAQVVVDDEGEGIPERIRSRVFTKFWRHGDHGGSGLGMYVVAGLAKAHDGAVHVETSPAGGARIRVLLPEGKPEVLNT